MKIINPYTFWRRQKDKLIEILPNSLFVLIINLRYIFTRENPQILKDITNDKDYIIIWFGGATSPATENYLKRSIYIFSDTPKCLMNPSLESYKQKNERFFKIEMGDTVVDVGACLGDTTIPALIKTGKTGKVIAIEPSPKNLVYLKKNTALYSNIVIIGKAAYNKKCTIPFNIHTTAVTGNMINSTGKNQNDSIVIDVEADTLDNLLKPFGKIDFLKIDVQGFEVEVLEGCKNIMKTTPKIVVETHGFDKDPLWCKVNKILVSAGYKTHVTSDRRVHAYRDGGA